MKTKSLILTLMLALAFSGLMGQKVQKHRAIILTDIEADPDDTQSLVRLLLYANEIDLKGLVATTSVHHKHEVNPESITKVIAAYEQVHPNLLLHDTDFPTAAELNALVCSGKAAYGMEGVGDAMDSEGSELIIAELEKNDDRPLWIPTWGGVNTLGQALYKMEKTKSKREFNKLVAKLRVYTISDQDDAGIWIRDNFPELFYIVTPGDDYGSATWNAINRTFEGAQNEYISNAWLAENIQQGHGPLGACYPDVAWGVEGDTPSFLQLILNGLNVPDHPEWGGWGGRYELYLPEFNWKKGGSGVPYGPESRPIWTDATDAYRPYLPSTYGRALKPGPDTYTSEHVSLWRWRADFQRDFAARMDWCTMSFEEANHAPEIVLSNPETRTVESGHGIGFDAFDSTDPDGDNLSFLWYIYPEPTGYQEKSLIGGANNAHGVYWRAPKVSKETTVHVILEVSDKGEPALKSYKRIIVTITP